METRAARKQRELAEKNTEKVIHTDLLCLRTNHSFFLE